MWPARFCTTEVRNSWDIAKLLLSCYLPQLSSNSKIHSYNSAISLNMVETNAVSESLCNIYWRKMSQAKKSMLDLIFVCGLLTFLPLSLLLGSGLVEWCHRRKIRTGGSQCSQRILSDYYADKHFLSANKNTLFSLNYDWLTTSTYKD